VCRSLGKLEATRLVHMVPLVWETFLWKNYMDGYIDSSWKAPLGPSTSSDIRKFMPLSTPPQHGTTQSYLYPTFSGQARIRTGKRLFSL
jgi:hypothetical protein